MNIQITWVHSLVIFILFYNLEIWVFIKNLNTYWLFFLLFFLRFYVFYSSACLSDAQPQFVTFQLKRSRNVSQICRFDKSRTSYTPNAAALERLFFLFWRTMQYNIRGFQIGDFRFKKSLHFLCTGSSRLMRILLVWISLLRFFKTFKKYLIYAF